MAYTVKEVSNISGVSVRALHFYDEIGLLKPAFLGDNGYRYYEKEQLLRLQQIMFFRELDISLPEIQKLLQSGTFDKIEALRTHKQLLLEKMKRCTALLTTIDKTILDLKGEYTMNNQEMYEGFDKEKQAQYEKELVERYGKSTEELIKQSKENTKIWQKKDYEELKNTMDQFHQQLTEAMEQGKSIDSSTVQDIVRSHFSVIQRFYTPSKEVYSGLGDLYVEHPEFRKLYDSYHPGLAEYLRDAMKFFAEHELG